MIQQMTELITQRYDFFLNLLIEHIQISLISILIAAIVGLFLGIIISEYRKSSKLILNIVNFIYTIPSISLLGFLIPFSGIGNGTAIIALSVYALLPMVRNTYAGITNINESIEEAAKGMGSTKFQILYKIKLPLAMPIIMSGLRNMATMTIALAGIASFIGAGGLGVAIYRGITTNNSAMTILGSLLIAILAILVDFMLGIIEKMVKRRSVVSHKKKVASSIVVALVCVCVAMFAIFSKQEGATIRVATKPMSEQYIMGEMLKLLIEHDTDVKVEITQGVGGGTSNIQPAMEKGEFDIYPEYTGTGWNMILKETSLYNEEMFPELKQRYESEIQLTWMGMYGFKNTYGIAVRKEIAEKYQLKTYSDLRGIANQLVFGAEYDFYEREDGYEALRKEYGLSFKNTVDLDIGLKYQAIAEGKIDVMNIFTTDGQLSVADVVVLEDDKNFYPSYMSGNVVRLETLERHPELEAVLKKLDGIVSDEKMAEMNYQVETEGKQPQMLAQKFLEDANLLP